MHRRPNRDRAAAYDVGSQSAAVDEPLQHARLRQLLEMRAWLGQASADTLDIPELKALPDEIVER